MSEFVESLRRLYLSQQLQQNDIKSLFTKGRITSSEFVYITTKEKKQ